MKKFSAISPFQRFLVALGAAVVVFAGVVSLDAYLFRIIQREAFLLIEAKAGIRGLEVRRDSLARERDWMRDHKDDISILERAFVDAANPLEFIETIEGAARSRGASLKLALPQKRGSVLAVGFTAEAGGDRLLSFLGAVENLSYQAVVRDFTFETLGTLDSKIGSTPARLVATIEVLIR